MRRPFWRTLAWRLTLAFVLVGTLAPAVVGLISGAATRLELSALLDDQEGENLAEDVRQYVRSHGAVSGFRPAGPTSRTPESGSPAALPGKSATASPVYRTPWIVLDTQRRAVFSTVNVRQGTRVTDPPAFPIRLDGQVVAHLALFRSQSGLDPRSEEFLVRTAYAILWAMLGAVLLAVLMGWWLSRTFLRPLGELLGGIRALQRGEAPTPVPRVRPDEFGEVLGAFEQMHQEVVRNQQARRQLTADIAHDLNTPLTVISGTLEGMLDGTFRPTPERLRRLHHETRHVARLLNDLRFLTLADAGELHVNRQPTEVVRLVAEAVVNFRELAEQRDVTLGIALDTGSLTVSLDPLRITQVLHNLLSNALAHTPAGGSVSVVAERGGPWLVVRVQDTGSGIAPEHLPHVFDRLYRADRSRSGEGSGLGLSICKSIVEAHGGHLSLTSTVGVGTTVTFELPTTPASTEPVLASEFREG